MDEHVLAAIVADDEAEAFLRIEEFDDALAFADDLRGHSASASAGATAAKAAAPAAATETAASGAVAEATATAASAITKATTSSTAAAEAGAILETAAIADTCFFEKSVALVSTASAAVPFAPLIETHTSVNFLVPANP
jgi:hypothetical protein